MKRELTYFCVLLHEVLTECPDTRFVVVGDGPDLAVLKALDRMN